MSNYTDADLEPAARRLCEIRGVDPDRLMRNAEHRRMWQQFLPELRAHLEREQALRETIAAKQREDFDKMWNPSKPQEGGE